MFDLDLKKHFEDRGYKIKAATVASDAGKTKSLGYGYLTFYEDSELERCFISMNNTMIKDKYIIVNRQGDNVRDPEANIIVRNIPKSVNQQDIFNRFKEFGNIKSCKLETFKDGISRGFAFV